MDENDAMGRDPPEGRNGWTLRLLAEKIVELEIAPKCSRMTVLHTLKKHNYEAQSAILRDSTEAECRVCSSDGTSACPRSFAV